MLQRSTLVTLCLLLPFLVQAGAPVRLAADNPRKLPEAQDRLKEVPKVDLGPQQCMEKCQRPVARCMERCSTDSDCAARCGRDLEACASRCGLKKD